MIRDLRALTPETVSKEASISLDEAASIVEDAWREGRATYTSVDGMRSYAETAIEVVCPDIDGCVAASVEDFRVSRQQQDSIEGSWSYDYELSGGRELRQFLVAERYVAKEHLGMSLCVFSSSADRALFGASDLAALRAAMEF